MTIPRYGWRHHPVVKMWVGYQEALVCYGLTMCARWSAMGAADTVAATLRAEFARPVRGQSELAEIGELPRWLGWADLHLSHQSSLLRKNPAYYRPIFGPDIPDDLPYVWPLSNRALPDQ